VAEEGFQDKYHSVRRFVGRLRQADETVPFRRMESAPGDQAQVDFGRGAPVIERGGRRKKTHVLRVVLSCSRKAYSETVTRQTSDVFIRCLENAFWHFGGVPKTLVIDNLRAAVTKADWYDPQINPKVQSFCEHYGTIMLPAKPYTPRHKGKVERGIGYVKDNALKDREFSSVAEQNKHLMYWETHIADQRIHGTTRKQVSKVFVEVERPTLLPLPSDRFPNFQEAKRVVHRDGYVEVQSGYYTVPPEYTGRQVWVRWDGHLVRIYNCQMELIAVRVQGQPGSFQTDPGHIHPRKRSLIERGPDWLLTKSSLIGVHSGRWARAMLAQRPLEGLRVLVGLLSLTKSYEADVINRACQTALRHQAFRLQTIRELAKRDNGGQSDIEFIDEHPIIRSMSEYGAMVESCTS
jgi:transposase